MRTFPLARWSALALVGALSLAPRAAHAQTTVSPVLDAPPAAASGASGTIDVDAATRAYLDELSADKKAKSDAYFEGWYWLQLWGFLWSAAVMVLLLQTGISARMRTLAERVTTWRPVHTPIYWAQLLVATAVLGFPFSVYQDFMREHAYGLSNLTFAGWMGEQGKGFLLSLVFGALAFTIFYAVLQRVPRTWWVWGSLVTVGMLGVVLVIAPIFIFPIFNTTTRLADQRVVQPILTMARANGINASEVWQIDASKQSKRVSANVSGLLGTERITLNDNLLNRASLPEIEAVMGHEMGHYVLNHAYKGLVFFGVLFVVGFAFVNALFERLRARFAAKWQIRDIGDLAGLPLISLLLSTYLFLMTPVLNTITRTMEYEADMFGVNAARQPDGFAQAALQLSEYRKLEPGPLEEILFYDHPSGRTRIHTAMRWKAEHPETWSLPAAAPAPARAATPPPVK